jgi:CBS domain-containing protein
MPDVPTQELWIALAGPLSSVVIAGVLVAGLSVTGRLAFSSDLNFVEGPFAARLAVVNVVIAGFNLLPAFPMDGGRVVRALLALRLDRLRATEIAAAIGRGMALLFVALGMVSSPLLVLVAIFVWVSAGTEERAARNTTALHGIPVSAVMRTTVASLAPDDTLERAVALTVHGGQRDFPVVRDDTLVGMLTGHRLSQALSTAGAWSTVAAAMQSEFETAEADEMLDRVIPRLEASGGRAIPVSDHGRLVGLLTVEGLGEFLRLQRARAPGDDANHPRPPRGEIRGAARAHCRASGAPSSPVPGGHSSLRGAGRGARRGPQMACRVCTMSSFRTLSSEPAANRMSFIDKTPTTAFHGPTTGSLRTRASRIVTNAARTSSSGPQVATGLAATAPTLKTAARSFRVASAMYMSRSVTMPTSSPSSTTGRMPQSASHISRAATATVVSGEHVWGSVVMISLTFMVGVSRLRCDHPPLIVSAASSEDGDVLRPMPAGARRGRAPGSD